MKSIVTYRFIVNTFVSFAVAQTIKISLELLSNKKVDVSRILGCGGMPSAHSCVVSCFATTAYKVYGLSSFEFAVSFIIACIVIADAIGVRLETGRQGKALNQLLSLETIKQLMTSESKTEQDKHFRELLGHTPIQAVVGIALGIALGFILCSI